MGSSARFPYKEGGLMQFSDNDIAWSQVEPYSTTHNWTLSGRAGGKTVYARFRDRDGNWSDAVKGTIQLSGKVVAKRKPSGGTSTEAPAGGTEKQ